MSSVRNAASLYLPGVEANHQPGPCQRLVTTCALFNFCNRWITATGVPEMSEDAHRQQGKSLASRGYGRE